MGRRRVWIWIECGGVPDGLLAAISLACVPVRTFRGEDGGVER